MDLKLQINNLDLQPGAPIDSGALEASDFQKQGLVYRLMKRLPPGHKVFGTKNCKVECFDQGFSLFPCTHSYLNRDRQWQTNATLLYVDGFLKEVVFCVLDGVYAAPNFMDKFKSICTEKLGSPQKLSNHHYSWTANQMRFSGLLSSDFIKAEFLIEFDHD